jgi:hypothetical protein
MASINQQIPPYIRAVYYIAYNRQTNITLRTLFLLYLFYMSVVVNKIQNITKNSHLKTGLQTISKFRVY